MRLNQLHVRDIRFPTSRQLDGSDAMNPDPDYSAAYVVVETDSRVEGHGLAFTIGRGNEVVVAAVRALVPLVVGRSLSSITANMGQFWREVTGDSQLRWIGPEKGAIHLATAAVVNAIWDLYAKSEGKPLWKLVADMEPAQVVACIDFRYLTDALTPDQAYELLRRNGGIRLTPPRPDGSAIRMRNYGSFAGTRSVPAGHILKSKSAAIWRTTFDDARLFVRRLGPNDT
jgi:L-fuconate dehydratase